jgi:hypothetical protein
MGCSDLRRSFPQAFWSHLVALQDTNASAETSLDARRSRRCGLALAPSLGPGGRPRSLRGRLQYQAKARNPALKYRRGISRASHINTIETRRLGKGSLTFAGDWRRRRQDPGMQHHTPPSSSANIQKISKDSSMAHVNIPFSCSSLLLTVQYREG